MTYRHLSVGINAYPGNELQGCVNDANDWNDLLTAGGSAGALLLDEQATLDAIETLLVDTIAQTRFRDTMIFTYSGHGTWVPDLDGDEADGRDEALVPYDFRRAGMLLDDRLYEIVQQNKHFGARLLFITDSCFSGTVERAFGDRGEFTHPRRARFLPPIDHLSPEDVHRARLVQSAAASDSRPGGAALFSGCAEEEVSWDVEFGQRANGAMTRAAVDAWIAYQPKSLSAWRSYTQERISADQHPQVQGSYAQRIRTDFMPHQNG